MNGISNRYLSESASRKAHLRSNLFWLLLAAITVFSGLIEIQNSVQATFAEPDAVKDAFIPLYRFSGPERIVFMVDGLKFQLGIVLILAIKSFFIYAKNSLSFAANYVSLLVIVPFTIFYVKWSAELIACADCSYSVSPFFPSDSWSGALFLLFSLIMLTYETLFLLVLLFTKAAKT